jgi:hypothetical protein
MMLGIEGLYSVFGTDEDMYVACKKQNTLELTVLKVCFLATLRYFGINEGTEMGGRGELVAREQRVRG